MGHILIKWKAEDCWDIIPLSEVQHNTCDKVGDVNNGTIIATNVKVKFEPLQKYHIEFYKKFCRKAL